MPCPLHNTVLAAAQIPPGPQPRFPLHPAHLAAAPLTMGIHMLVALLSSDAIIIEGGVHVQTGWGRQGGVQSQLPVHCPCSSPRLPLTVRRRQLCLCSQTVFSLLPRKADVLPLKVCLTNGFPANLYN